MFYGPLNSKRRYFWFKRRLIIEHGYIHTELLIAAAECISHLVGSLTFSDEWLFWARFTQFWRRLGHELRINQQLGIYYVNINSANFLDAGYVWAPYIPINITPIPVFPLEFNVINTYAGYLAYRYQHHDGYAEYFNWNMPCARDTTGIIHSVGINGNNLQTTCTRSNWEGLGPMRSTADPATCALCIGYYGTVTINIS